MILPFMFPFFLVVTCHVENDLFPVQVAGLDAYEAMPVEAFGEAMLRGMGWQEGKSVGKNAKEVRGLTIHNHSV